MANHEKFNFKTVQDLEGRIKELGVDISLEKDISPLSKPVKIGKFTAPNGFAVLPMEGCDSNPDGSPTELVERRYLRFASGGAGLLWWEACAVVEEGKANPNQMMLTPENMNSFQKLMDKVNQVAKETMGQQHNPIHILQLTHSGRYSRPYGEKIAPLITQHDPLLDPRVGLTESALVVSDEYLDTLPEFYAKSAKLAKEVGFHGVDIKCCHRYLLSELLASHTREGKYGGSFENRTSLLVNIIRKVKEIVGGDFILACRFNVFDAHPYPYGFGCSHDNLWDFDPTEPVKLVKLLVSEGISLLSNTAGNPYYVYPQVTRPFDQSSMGIPVPEEHPLESTARLFHFTKVVQEAAGDVPVVGNGYTWLRQYIPEVGSHNLKSGGCSFVGLGRSSFAYPDAPKDFIQNGKISPEKCCVTCSKCTQIMRDHGMTGCVIKDSKLYLPKMQEARKHAEERENSGK